MCVAESDPMRETQGEMMPTKTDRPVVDHPPFWKTVQTSDEVERGARAHIGIMIARNPTTCSTNTTASMMGK
jgi:hypothetical protein